MHEIEEFWDELMAMIADGHVIPVIGPELLTISRDGQDVPLYQVLAEQLLEKYGLGAAGVDAPDAGLRNDQVVLIRPYNELNDAVCGLVRRGKRVQDLYRPINDLLVSLLASHGDDALKLLRQLAGISGFSLFVSTTPDDLLARAIDAERHEGRARTHQIVFTPKQGQDVLNDLPDPPSADATFVCYLFGKASPVSFVYAIHDEDTLEFIHKLQINAGVSDMRLFKALRTHDLLLIGCNFADWLSRLFIRLSNTQRLALPHGKHEFLIEESTSPKSSLTLFLERFSADTWVFPANARAFVAELSRRWADRHPLPIAVPARIGPQTARPGLTIFISYSRTDIREARELHSGLTDIGASVAWFDKGALKPGDDWSDEIRKAVGRCHLFLALVSANTEQRDEGFFREEWLLACERARKIQGRKFIVPIIVDQHCEDGISRFALVPEAFRGLQFGHAPAGKLSDDLRRELTRLIRERQRAMVP